MKELFLMRHAKSDWSADFGADRHRPLNKRGHRAARAMGEALARADRVPDLAVSSPAVRATTTLDLAIEAGGWICERRVQESIYGSGAEGLLSVVRAVGSETERLLVVGHQPTMSSVVSRLIGGGSVRFPTAAIAALRLPVPRWEDADWNCAELEFFLTPRALGTN